MKKLAILLLLICVFISCESKKELELQNREKAVIIKEEEFKKKEADYKTLLLMRDSLAALKNTINENSDLIKKWPEFLKGFWNSKTLCRESNCNQYVIGDQRNESWEFVSDSTGIYTNVLNNKKLVRVFKAKYIEDKIMLEFTSDSISKNRVKMNVVLDDIKENIIKGTQTITGQDNCTARFSVELTLAKK
ncbi:hypothetical protein B0A67_18910 [Flavobacterium aquidurense]|uniref:hypothetical protein n=1 Tax=Flavobacterium aquidurense TaxID=362413 RepID=UPI00091C2E43|nr:hypothetical protein [Flavobacterium aquidurense]OXA69782.1 hypothetical protein B0A67_18910 [Flavobacterium aquidurense]SHH26018.1 hypothetical protein SAMN05444481_11418 [Flavobacterium frigidimaris]